MYFVKSLLDSEKDLTKMNRRLKTIVENGRLAHFKTSFGYTYEIEHSQLFQGQIVKLRECKSSPT